MAREEVLSGTVKEVTMGEAGTAVKEGVVSSLKGINEIEAEIVSLVRNTVSNTLRATGEVATESVTITKDVVIGAIQATEEVGTGLILSTKSVAKGIVMGVSDVGGDVIIIASQTCRVRLKERRKLVRMLPWWRAGRDGVIEASKEVGANSGKVAVAAVDGAIDANCREIRQYRSSSSEGHARRGCAGRKGSRLYFTAEAARDNALCERACGDETGTSSATTANREKGCACSTANREKGYACTTT